jgi:hypothetical protein
VNRLLRATYYILAPLPALLFVATVAVWTASYRYFEGIDWNRPSCLVGLRCSSGLLWLDCERADPALWSDGESDFMGVHLIFHLPAREEYTNPPIVKSNKTWGNFRFGSFRFLVSEHRHESWSKTDYLAAAPAWVLSVLSILPLAWYLRGWKRTAKCGCCSVCGYDLRATRNRCPECGTATRNEENRIFRRRP